MKRTFGLPRKLNSILPRAALVTIFKTFVRLHLDNQAFNTAFYDNLESIQYNACLTITRANRGTSRENLSQGLGLDLIADSFACFTTY